MIDVADNWLADGFHRYFGHQKAGLLNIECEIRKGSARDAILFAVGANAKHGLRRTNADKRKAVNLLLVDQEWSKWSDSEIGRRCGVDHKTVASQRSILGNSQDAKPESRTVKRGDTVYQQNTANIGKNKAEVSSAKKKKVTNIACAREVKPRITFSDEIFAEIIDRIAGVILSVCER